jgi:hypothetical protein
MPDANYVSQLVKIYDSHEGILHGVGTDEAFSYSYYSFFESFILLFAKISGISHVIMLRFFYTIYAILFFTVWKSIYEKISHDRTRVYIALIIALTSFNFSSFFVRPLNPSYAFLFSSLLLFALILPKYYDNTQLIPSIIFAFAISLSHNTMGLVLIFLVILSIILAILNRVIVAHSVKAFTDVTITKRIIYVLIIVSSIYLVYNLYVTFLLFKKGVISNILSYLASIFSMNESLFLNILPKKISIISCNEVTTILYLTLHRIGNIMLLFYMFISAILLLICTFHVKNYTFLCSSNRKTHTQNIELETLFDFLALATAILIVIGYIIWPTHIRDYYWRFYSYYFFFSAPRFTNIIARIRIGNKLKSLLIFAILLNFVVSKSSIILGIDTPYNSLSDPRVKLLQAIKLAMYINERYHETSISGTRVVFENIGPICMKWVSYLIYSQEDLLKAINMKNLIIISKLESLIIGLDISNYISMLHIHMLFNSGDFVILQP